jgi:hypothetical protein
MLGGGVGLLVGFGDQRSSVWSGLARWARWPCRVLGSAIHARILHVLGKRHIRTFDLGEEEDGQRTRDVCL